MSSTGWSTSAATSSAGREMIQAHESMGALGRAYARIVMGGPRTREQVEKIAEVLRKAAADLDTMG